MPITVTIRETANPATQSLSSDAINRIYIITTVEDAESVEESLFNTPVPFSLEDLNATEVINSDRPQIPKIVRDSIYGIYLNSPDASIYLVYSHAGDLTSVVENLTAGIDSLMEEESIFPGVILCPERATLEEPSPRTTLQKRLDDLCRQRYWMFFANITLSTDTVEEAIGEAGLHTSELGHTAFYYGSFVYEDRECPVSALAAATVTKASRREGASQSPAGAFYPLIAPSSINNYVSRDLERDELKDQGINVAKLVPGYGYCLWGARTLSKNSRFRYINTRQCINQIARQLKISLTPYLLDPIDPGGRTTAEIIMISTSIMESAFENNYLSGERANEAYSVRVLPTTEEGIIKIEIVGNFINTIEEIEITLINGEIVNGDI